MQTPKKLQLRRVAEKDSDQLLLWRNDPVTRKNSFSSKKIKPEEHCAWLAATLKAQNRILLMGLGSNRRPIGVLRYDFTAARKAEVNINVNPKERGKGFGALLLSRGNRWLEKNTKLKTILAKIKKNNKASQNAFLKSGFCLLKKMRSYDLYAAKLHG